MFYNIKLGVKMLDNKLDNIFVWFDSLCPITNLSVTLG